jgi:hypothetical protein
MTVVLPIVKLRISNDASNSQTAKMCAIWVETAHEEFTDLPGRDPKLYLEIMAILKKRVNPLDGAPVLPLSCFCSLRILRKRKIHL